MSRGLVREGDRALSRGLCLGRVVMKMRPVYKKTLEAGGITASSLSKGNSWARSRAIDH